MKTLFLHFEHETAALAALAPFLDEGLCVDIVGRMYARASESPDAAPVPLAGWHVNVLADVLPEALQPYEVFPETPARVFAIEPEPLRVPQEVTMAQCRLALFDQHAIETDEQFFALADILPEAARTRARLELRTRPTVRRDNPLVEALGQANGWDIDALFIYAGGL